MGLWGGDTGGGGTLFHFIVYGTVSNIFLSYMYVLLLMLILMFWLKTLHFE